jgi:hypothetical protein
MYKIILLASCLAVSPAIAKQPVDYSKPVKVAVTCFATGEQTSGMNKICFYDCLGSQAAITISSVALCPLSINR